MSTATLPEQISGTLPSSRDKYVVLHEMIGGRSGTVLKRGQCVDQHAFPLGADFDWLCLKGIVRPALSHEQEQSHVDVNATLRPGQQIMEAYNRSHADIQRLTIENKRLLEENEQVKISKSANYDPTKDEKFIHALKAKEDVIRGLEADNKKLLADVEALNRRLNAKVQTK